jgi:MscS family membrane protein
MQTFIDWVNSYLTVFGVPGTKVLAAAAIIALALILNRLFARVVLRYFQRLTRKTETTLDDEMVEILKHPLGWLIILVGFSAAHAIMAEHLTAQLSETLQKGIGLGLLFVLALIVFRCARVLAEVLDKLSKRTRTEIDDLIVPYVPAFIQAVAVLIVLLKASEILLGVSAAALIGLLGGAGITLGLVFKDVISDWFATVIIHADGLYRPGDVIQLQDGVFAIAEEIGLRSTTARTFDGPVVRIPNSQMVSAGVRNWSQAPKWKASCQLRLDGVSSEKVAKVAQGIREILKSEKAVDQSWHIVYLGSIEGNSRVIEMEYYAANPGGLDAGAYYDQFVLTREKVNLAILALLEQERIDHLAYTLFGSIGDYGRRIPVEDAGGEKETMESLLMVEQRKSHGK